MIVVGAPGTHIGDTAGSAYVFVRGQDSWTFDARIVPTDLQPRDWFGKTVTLPGAGILIGATGHWDDLEEPGYVSFFDGALHDINPADGIPDECGACCLPAGCVQMIAGACATVGESYLGDGTDCMQSPCAPIPTMSAWGLLTLLLCILSVQKSYSLRHSAH